MARNKRTREMIVADLQRSLNRLKEVQEKGDEAISDYDLRFGYDAEFYLVRCPILANHVRSYLTKKYNSSAYNKK